MLLQVVLVPGVEVSGPRLIEDLPVPRLSLTLREEDGADGDVAEHPDQGDSLPSRPVADPRSEASSLTASLLRVMPCACLAGLDSSNSLGWCLGPVWRKLDPRFSP